MKNKKEIYIKVLIIVLLVLLIVITSFRTGRKFYLLTSTYFDETKGKVSSSIAKWKFEVKIRIGDEVLNNEE